MSHPTPTIPGMVKFDPEGFLAMMARIEAEDRDKAVVRSPYEDLEPDYEFLPAPEKRSGTMD